MIGRSHPARRARVVVGVAGSAGFIAMVGTISDASTEVLATDLSAALEINVPQAESGLELQGSAVPGSGVDSSAVTSDSSVMEEAPDQGGSVTEPSAPDAPTTAPPAQASSTTTASAQAASSTTTTTTTAAVADQTEATEPPESSTTQPTTPPATTTTTVPAETDTTSSGS